MGMPAEPHAASPAPGILREDPAHKTKRCGPGLTIFDGTWFLDKTGPMVGEPVPMNLLIASDDSGAGSMACCDIMQIHLMWKASGAGPGRRAFPGAYRGCHGQSAALTLSYSQVSARTVDRQFGGSECFQQPDHYNPVVRLHLRRLCAQGPLQCSEKPRRGPFPVRQKRAPGN